MPYPDGAPGLHEFLDMRKEKWLEFRELLDDDPSFDWSCHKLEFKLENSKSWGKKKRSLKVKVVKKKFACEATIPPVQNLRNGPRARE